MNKGVAITGFGIISSIGMNREENLNALLSQKPGISRIENISTRLSDKIKVGEIKTTNETFIQQLNLPEENNFGRTSLLALWAAREAVEHAGMKDFSDGRNGFISATSVAGMDKTEQYLYDNLSSPTHRRYIESHQAGDHARKIAKELGIKDVVTTISTACSSSANSIMLGARLIQAGKLDRVIVGGADCLSKFTCNGFNSLMILSEDNCKPFDENRTGLNLGEAAAFLVLESDDFAKNKTVYGRVTGYANSNDAFHQTASSENGDGATLSMTNALKVAQLQPSEISYINAHGTATPNNDLSESIAIQRVFEKVPPFSSTKAFTGHTLAAAAVIEAVYSLFALEKQIALPNLNFDTPIAQTGLVPVQEVTAMPINHIVSNSFGFGGNCSTLIFSKA